jgi:uncharacterized membrane protein YkoI
MGSYERIFTLAVLGFGLTAAASRADEEKVPLDKVPAPVLKAFKAKFPEATIKAAIKEVEDGKTVYEIESTSKGLAIDAVLKPDGEFVNYEKEIKSADLPAKVASAVKAKHPKGKVKKVEEVTEGDKSFYEVLVEEGDKSTEVSVGKDGKIIE